MGCVCASGYKGQTCTDLVTECDSAPCLNGATCTLSNGLTGYAVCICASGYTGTYCDQRK